MNVVGFLVCLLLGIACCYPKTTSGCNTASAGNVVLKRSGYPNRFYWSVQEALEYVYTRLGTAGHIYTEIDLVPTNSTNCSVSAIKPSIRKSLSHPISLVNRGCINVVLRGKPGEGCQRATIRSNHLPPYQRTPDGLAMPRLVWIENSSCIGIRDVEFSDTNIDDRSDHRPLIMLRNSSSVLFSGVDVRQTRARRELLVLDNPRQVEFNKCTFHGPKDNTSHQQGAVPSGRGLTAVGVTMRNQNCGTLSNETAVKFINCTFDAIGSGRDGFNQDQIHRQERMQWSSGTALDVLAVTSTSCRVRITACTFLGYRSGTPYSVPLKVSLTEGSVNNSVKIVSSTFQGSSALDVLIAGSTSCRIDIADCSFLDCRTPYSAPLRVSITKGSENNSVKIVSTTFQGNTGLLSGATLVQFKNSKKKSKGNEVHIEECGFHRNLASYEGGALSALLIPMDGSRFLRNKIRIINCNFTGNKANGTGYLAAGSAILIRAERGWRPESPTMTRMPGPQGNEHVPFATIANCSMSGNVGRSTVQIIHADGRFCGETTISDNNGTAVTLTDAVASVEGNFIVTRNNAPRGAGIMFEQRSRLDATQAKLFIIKDNRATYSGSAIFAHHASSSSTMEELIYHINRPQVSRNTDQCPIKFPSDEKSIQTVLQGNLYRPGVPAVLMASLHRCFNYFEPFLRRQFDTRCYCPPYMPTKWEAVVSNQDFYNVRDMYIKDPIYQEACDQYDSHNLQSDQSNLLLGGVCWRNSTKGYDESMASLQSATCDRNNSNLMLPLRCYSRMQNIYVINKLKSLENGTRPMGTSMAWLFFRRATTSCYKPIGNRMWYFARDCHAENGQKGQKGIIQSIFTAEEALNISTDCVLHRMNFLYRHLVARSVIPVLPGYALTLVPWAGMISFWDRFKQNVPAFCKQDDAGHSAPTDSISTIFLNPAPGERFSLSVKAADELLNIVPMSLSMKVISNNGDVILGLDNAIYTSEEPVIFSSLFPSRQIALYGPVNASGRLLITGEGKRTYYYTTKHDLQLRVRFVLRHCHSGFSNLMTTSEEARKIAESFANPSKRAEIMPKVIGKMACQCAAPADNACNVTCDRNRRTVYVSNKCWAGEKNEHNLQALDSATVIWKSDRKKFEDSYSYRYHQSWPSQDDGGFVAAVCDRLECTRKSNTSRHWQLNYDNPCADACNCTGPMCSDCLPDTIRLPSSVGCVDCRGRHKIHLPVFFTLLSMCALLVIALLLFFNVGISPTLDSWMFFYQVMDEMYYDMSWQGTVVLRAMITFGLGLICQHRSISGLAAQAIQLYVPLFQIAVIILLWLLARRGVAIALWQHLQKRNSVVHVFWLVILYSSAMVAEHSAMLLRSVRLGDTYVLYKDGTVERFSDEHKPYAAFAFLVLFCVVLPPPLILFWRPLHIWPSLKGFIDEATHIYEDKCTWWASVNLLRRLVPVLIHTLVVDGTKRRLAFAMVLLAAVAAQGIFRPFKRNATLWRFKDVNNLFEMALLLLLSFLSIAYIVAKDVLDGDKAVTLPVFTKGVTMTAVTVVALAIVLYRMSFSWKRALRREPRNSARGVCLTEETGCSCPHNTHNAMALELCDSRTPRPVSVAIDQSSSSDGARSSCSSKAGRRADMDIVDVHTGLRDPLLAEHLYSMACTR